jgi:ubiquinone/menaquinone biosynthesis C-methylase UbiE
MSGLSFVERVEQLRAAGEPTRARILLLLARGELSVGELAQVLGQSQPRLSRHLKLLTAAGLVERLPEGAWVFYRLPSDAETRMHGDGLVSGIRADDEVLRRDAERLADVKAARAKAAETYFSRVAEEWDRLRALHFADAAIEEAVLAAAGDGPFDLVVDFGTGTGRMLALFAGRARRVEGIDLNHHMLTVARANLDRAGLANAAVRHGDAAAAPYADATADLVIIHQVLHFLDDPGRALAEAGRILKPGGRLVAVDFAPHALEHLRTEHSHRHLGVAAADFARWSHKGGLSPVSEATFESPSGQDGVAVKVWAVEKAGQVRQGRAA